MQNKFSLVLSIIIILFIAQKVTAQSISVKDIQSSGFESLNLINVTIGGAFPLSGTYPASRTERVDQLVTRIFTEYKSEIFKTTPDENLLSLLNANVDKFAKRGIILKRFNGEEIKLDLVKFRITGDFKDNPYLQNDDVLIFPPLDLERNFVVISGAVNKETKFQFIDGDKLSDAILFAQGINPAYTNVDSAQISRLSNDGLIEEILNFRLDENPSLKRGDRITILSDENKKKDYSVLILGEIKRPGKIYITKNNTTLKEVIKKAGGFTEKASLKFADLVRDYDSFNALRRISIEKKNEVETNIVEQQKLNIISNELEFLKMFRAANLEMRDTLYFGFDNKLRTLSGLSNLDFRNLEKDSSYESNYLVNDKDVIIVPQETKQVYVWGGVGKIGYYPYEENMNVWDYIKNAGGYTEIAYGEDEVYLIKGKSYDWLRVVDNDKLTIEPGDYIYAKKETPTQEFWFYLSRIGAVAGILGSVATVYLLLKTK